MINENSVYDSYSYSKKLPRLFKSYLSSILHDEDEIDSLLFFLSQIIGGRVYVPILFLGGFRTGKTTLVWLLEDVFKPDVSITHRDMFSKEKYRKFNSKLFLGDEILIGDMNVLPKRYKKYAIFRFNNHFDKSNGKFYKEIFNELKPEYDEFVSLLTFCWSDITNSGVYMPWHDVHEICKII